jgi:hypothetical protein
MSETSETSEMILTSKNSKTSTVSLSEAIEKSETAAIDKHFISYMFFFLFLYSNADFTEYANTQRNLLTGTYPVRNPDPSFPKLLLKLRGGGFTIY